MKWTNEWTFAVTLLFFAQTKSLCVNPEELAASGTHSMYSLQAQIDNIKQLISTEAGKTDRQFHIQPIESRSQHFRFHWLEVCLLLDFCHDFYLLSELLHIYKPMSLIKLIRHWRVYWHRLNNSDTVEVDRPTIAKIINIYYYFDWFWTAA